MFDESFAPMLKSRQRFARQYDFWPPSEFPLTSPYSSIVHTLSGLNRGARAQIRPRTSGSADDAGLPLLASVHFHCAFGFYAQILAPLVNSLVRVSRRAARCPYASDLGCPSARAAWAGAITLRKELRSPTVIPPRQSVLAWKTERAEL